MADYTPEQVEKLAEFARWAAKAAEPDSNVRHALVGMGLVIGFNGTLADWLWPEDWADRAAREAWPYGAPADRARLAAIIRRHAEDRT